jgi:hypothetical protein
MSSWFDAHDGPYLIQPFHVPVPRVSFDRRITNISHVFLRTAFPPPKLSGSRCLPALYQIQLAPEFLLDHTHTSPDINCEVFVSCVPPRSSPMEQDSIERAAPTAQLLNLIRDERDWKVGEAEAGGRSRNTVTDAEEDRKLELKLGLPDVQGEEKTARPGEKIEQDDESYTALSLGCFPAHSKLSTNTSTTGAKRGLFATVDAKPQGTGNEKYAALFFSLNIHYFLQKFP